MKTYVVGGAVRDRLLGLPVSDRDHVVVGARPEDLTQRGFLPVGRDFPVFLHPETHEEYALARTERKSGRGYAGFVFHSAPEVTLEQDLARRDLTINAMAEDEHGQLIDPFGGQNDLKAGLFRHVGQAFAEDPVRILRVARFAARLPQFRVHPDTLELMCAIVVTGEVDALVAERVWQEWARGLMERQPSRMFAVLADCGALARIAPELDHAWKRDVHGAACDLRALDLAAVRTLELPQRYALLMQRVATDSAQAMGQRLRVPNECRELAALLAREHAMLLSTGLDDSPASAAAHTLALFERCDALRRPERFAQLLVTAQVACCAEHSSEPGAPLGTDSAESADVGQYDWLDLLATARAVDAGAAARAAPQPSEIPMRVRAARLAALERALAVTVKQ